jgi:hypothetical protein
MSTQEKQYQVMLAKNDDYARIILSSALSKKETWTAYYAFYLPRITFIIPNCYFNEVQLDKIQWKATHATLAKGGYVSTMPRAAVYGPHKFGGITMRPLWVEQIVEQVKIIVKHFQCPGDCSIMLRITYAWAQLNSGMGFHLLE